MSITVSFILTPFSSTSAGRGALQLVGHQLDLQPSKCPGRQREWPTVTDGLDLDGFRDPLLRAGLHRLAAHLGLEQRVHQSGLPQAALSCEIDEHTQALCLHPPEEKCANSIPRRCAAYSVEWDICRMWEADLSTTHMSTITQKHSKTGLDDSNGGLKPLGGI